MRRGSLLQWRVLGLPVEVLSEGGSSSLARGSGEGCLVAVVCWATLGVVLVGLLLPLRVRAPNVGSGE